MLPYKKHKEGAQTPTYLKETVATSCCNKVGKIQYTTCSFNYSWQYSNLRLKVIWETNLEMAKKIQLIWEIIFSNTNIHPQSKE